MATRKVYKHEHIFIVYNVIQANTSKLKQIPRTRQSRPLMTYNQRHYFTRSSLVIWYSGVKWAAYEDIHYCSQQLVATGWITSLHACKHTHKNSQLSRGSCFQIKKRRFHSLNLRLLMSARVNLLQRLTKGYWANRGGDKPPSEVWRARNGGGTAGTGAMSTVARAVSSAAAQIRSWHVDCCPVIRVPRQPGSQPNSFTGCFLFSV